MAPAPINPESIEGDQMEKLLDREIREMISALTHRLAQLRHHDHDHVHKHDQLGHDADDDHHGVRIVTLAGSNTGAAMRGELDSSAHGHGQNDDDKEDDQALGGTSTYVNSNFQAINSSIMLGGSYSTNDPGVHLDISDFIQDPNHLHPHPHGAGHMKHAGKLKTKKKDHKETSRGDHHSEPPSD